ncbi:MAG TPA: Pycsar system effector family protein [Arenimonas sp.]|uniref:Pycsar system effector family protein n=1 Tax=Arenimonas sp. TaxID=1872635 RepID=UPI002C884C56|nr:Pycsar system effector family protein [Arenimonas sp.]HMB56547.1 Pycsar system effector family protein [Arenimonas sp.]
MAPNEPNDSINRAFAAIPERNTGDNMLRTMQQHHVQLSVMADTKANILITVSSIVLTMVLGKLSDPDLRAAMLTLAGFILTALLLAVIAVLPKYRPLRLTPGAPLPPQFNLMFFGHFAELPKERFLAEIAESLKADGSVYETMARDVYSIGFYLAHYKYRFLRLSYLFFLGGFVCACIVEAFHLLAH